MGDGWFRSIAPIQLTEDTSYLSFRLCLHSLVLADLNICYDCKPRGPKALEKSIDLFLSHNRADKRWTERLAGAIEMDRRGRPLKVFFDKWDIPPGGDIPAELEAGLQNCRHVGLVLTPEALLSDWVALERSTAIYRDPGARRRSLIPLLRRDCKMPDMLARLKYIDFRREADFSASLVDLTDLLRGHPARRNVSADEISITLESVPTAETTSLVVPRRATIEWVLETARRAMKLKDRADVGTFKLMTLHWVLVQKESFGAWNTLPWPERFRSYAVFAAPSGPRLCVDPSERFEAYVVEDGTVFHLCGIGGDAVSTVGVKLAGPHFAYAA